jgi:hypothetical protein
MVPRLTKPSTTLIERIVRLSSKLSEERSTRWSNVIFRSEGEGKQSMMYEYS